MGDTRRSVEYQPAIGDPHKRLSFAKWAKAYGSSTGTFWLGNSNPTITFTDDLITIGCKEITPEAFEELIRIWREFKNPTKREMRVQ